MAKKNAYDSEADVIELTTPETTIIDLSEIVQPARKPADTADVDFNDELTDFIGTNGALDAQPELDSLLSDLGGSVKDTAPGNFAGVMEDAVASASDDDAVGALIDDLNPPPNGDASDTAGEEPQEELDSLLDSLFSSPAATRIASATEETMDEATEASSAGPIPPAPEAGSDTAPHEEGASSVEKDVFGDLDSLLDGLDDLDGPSTAAAPAAPAPAPEVAPEAKPSAVKPSPAKASPAPQAAKAAAPVEDAFPDLDSLLEGLDDLDGPSPAAAPAAPVSTPEVTPEAKPSAKKPSPAQQTAKAASSAKDIFADFDSLLKGKGAPSPAAAPAAPVSTPGGASGVVPERAAPEAKKAPPVQPSPAPQAAKAAAPVEDAFPDLDSLLDGLDDLDSPTAAPSAASVAPAAPVPEPVLPEPASEPVLPEQAPVRGPEAEDVLDELDLLLDGVEGRPEPPVKHDDTAEIDAILDEALVPEDASAVSAAPTLDILLPDEEDAPALPAEEDKAADEAHMPQMDMPQDQPDQETLAEPSAALSEPVSEEADLSGNPEEVLRNIDELLEDAPDASDAPLAPANQALEPVEEDARSADALTTAPRNVGIDPAAAARLATCEQRLEELDGRLAALESASEQPEAPDVPEVDPQAITEDVLTRVRADLAEEQTAANERSASALRDLGARLDAVEAARAQDAARPVELSSDQVETVAARVETLLADRLAERLALALEDRLAERLGERLSANLKDRLAADLPAVMEARLADALREPICEAAVERTRDRLLPALEKEMAVAERKAEEETSFALVEMENRITALEGRPIAKWPNTAKLAEEVLDRLHGDIDRMAAESASRVLREEIAALVKGLA